MRRLVSIALALLLCTSAAKAAPVETGLERLEKEGFAPLLGKRVGLVTNHTGKDRSGKSAVDLLFAAKGLTLTALFSPEHGLRGLSDAAVASGKDEATGLPVHSLYGKTKKPSQEMLANLDVLVFDIQDVGARFYTYISTLGLCMEACAESGKEILVLDRPNPIGGTIVEGPILEPSLVGGFASFFALPTRHGMTVGEVARWYDAEKSLGCKLTVLEMRGWKRAQRQDETGLPWIDPSPNMRSLKAATHYPGLGALEASNLSVGRGTETPFELYGAPWVDGEKLAALLQAKKLAGVRWRAVTFTPRPVPGMPRYPYTDEACKGVAPEITDAKAYRPVLAALHTAAALRTLHKAAWKPGGFASMLGDRGIDKQLADGVAPEAIVASWKDGLEAFAKAREKALLYRE